jgi:hypothetical protein
MKLFGNSNMKQWELLIQRCPGHEDEYSEMNWQTMVDGIVESFNKYTGIPFSFAKPCRFFLDQNDPSAGFDLIYKVSTPIEPLIYYVKGSIDTYYTDNKKPTLYYVIDHPSNGIAACYVDDEKRERGITVSLFLFLYFGEKRLIGENLDVTQNDDYIVFEYIMEPQNCYWKNWGWDSGFECEWAGLKYPK